MSLLLTASPDKLINGLQSNVNAGRSQLPFTFQREDYPIQFVYESNVNAGRIRALLPASFGDISSEFGSGDLVYLFQSNGAYNGLFTVDFADFASETRIYMLQDNVYGVNGNGGYLNNLTTKPNYKVNINLLKTDGTPLIDLAFLYSPAPDGSLFVDVGQMLTEYQEANLDTSVSFNLQYLEQWNGTPNDGFYEPTDLFTNVAGVSYWFELGIQYGDVTALFPIGSKISWSNIYIGSALGLKAGSSIVTNTILVNGDHTRVDFESSDVLVAGTATGKVFNQAQASFSTVIQSIYGEKQIYQLGGSNLWEYLLNAAPVGKLLTTFKNPLLWRGFWRSSNCLIDSRYNERTTYTGVRFYQAKADINKAVISEIASDNLPILPAILNNSIDFYDNTTKYVITGMQAAGFFLSEKLIYKVLEPDCKNGIYVGWVNSLGGLEEHLFELSQEVNEEVEQGLLAVRAINQDQEFVNRTKIRNPKTSTQSIIMRADGLLEDQRDALIEIKKSNFVVIYLNKEATKYVFAIVSNGYSNIYDTKNQLFEFTLQLELPDNFDLFKVKEY